jgi:hypothetical protein
MGEIWQLVLEKRRGFHQKVESVWPFGDFLHKRKIGHNLITFLIINTCHNGDT